jgi:hypothetical protein
MQTHRKISAQDAHRVELFKDLITVGAEAEQMRRALTELYFDHSRMVIKRGQSGDFVTTEESENGLYYLTEIIQLLENHDLPEEK